MNGTESNQRTPKYCKLRYRALLDAQDFFGVRETVERSDRFQATTSTPAPPAVISVGEAWNLLVKSPEDWKDFTDFIPWKSVWASLHFLDENGW